MFMDDNKNTSNVTPVAEHQFVINIGRQLGSGGRQIGRILAEELNIAYFDKEILALAAKESGFCEDIFKRNDEKVGFFGSMFGSVVPFMGGSMGGFENEFYYYENQVSDENLFRIQSDAIRKAASQQSCIFIGRCADYILRDFPRCVNVFVVANEEDRIRRIMLLTECDEKEARKMIQKGDENRAEFYNFYSSGEWGAAATYDLCVNSSVLGIEGTAHFIKEFVQQKLAVLK